jgi:hypothetical protein
MTWFNFPGWGDYSLNGVAEKELAATGAHGYATQALADASPNASPNAIQAGLLQTFNAQSLSPAGAGTGGVLQTPHSTGGVTGAASNLAGNVGSGLLGGLFQKNIWMRAGEVLVGLILLGIGLNAMLKGKPLQVVTTAAGTVGKAVP